MNVYALFAVARKSLEGSINRVPVRCKTYKSRKIGETSKSNMFGKFPTINPKPDPIVIENEPIKASGENKAMAAYLERVQKYNKFMAEERTAYDIGKRHLANMMGRDPENFTQADIDESIEYLFPCSLYERRARPLMKPPEEIFPPKKEAEFDMTGRPHHFLFYTGKPNYYQILHDAVKLLKQLDDSVDQVITGKQANLNFAPIPLDASTWITKQALERMCSEPISDKEYEQLKMTLERVAGHAHGNKCADFVLKYCFEMQEKSAEYQTRTPVTLEDGRQRILLPGMRQRQVLVNVSVTYPGTGVFLIDNKDIQFFHSVQNREAVLFPLVLTKMLKKVDVEAQTLKMPTEGGHTPLALAIRTSVARGLYHFVDDFTKDKMKLAGLLSQEIRQKERKKPGQEGARRKFTWRKR